MTGGWAGGATCVVPRPRCNASGLDIQATTTTMAAAINITGHPLWFNFHCAGARAGGGGGGAFGCLSVAL